MRTYAAFLLIPLTLLACLAPAGEARETSQILNGVSRTERRIRARLKPLVESKGLTYPPGDVFLRVFKLEEELELWARNGPSGPFTLVKTYKAFNLPLNYTRGRNGGLQEAGPKRRMGDGRVPEGIYKILYHNPWSSYHLSLAIGYPNPSDAILGRRMGTISARGERAALNWWRRHGRRIDRSLLGGMPGLWGDRRVNPLGNEIFIHGKEVTVGCIPIGDRNIEEVFVLTDARKVGGTQVHIFPFRFADPDNLALRRELEERDEVLAGLWRSLESVYRYFEERKDLPPIYIDRETGLYSLTADPRKMAY
ncbi:MAG: L,D-transpeptidase family protein [bacterium]